MTVHPRIAGNRFVLAPVILLLVAGLVAGILTGAFASVARRGLYATGLLTDGGSSTVPPGVFSSPARAKTSEPPPQGQPPAVLAPAQAGPVPKADRVAAKLRTVKTNGMKGRVGGSVLDGGTGKALYGRDASKPYIPASTLKLLTATGALSVLGPQHQFTTTVVSVGKGRLTLVGGGDPYLMTKTSRSEPDRASLSRLAELTAARLKQDRVSRVALDYDASLFSGPQWHPDWPARYRDQVSPITALWVNEGRVRGAVGPRVSDPAKKAAEDFAEALEKRGVGVSTVTKAKAKAKAGARPIAAVKSLPLDRIVERLLMVSDNDAAEVVARQAAIGAGQPGSFTGGRNALQARLARLGVWDSEARLRDGSGLSRRNQVPAQVLSRVLRLSMDPAHPELRAVVTGLPVAGVEGSLRDRFSDETARSARGLIRAKTGTLTEVTALAGYVRTPDGSLLVYAFVVNKATDYFASRAWLDRVLAALSTCGCR